MGTPGKGSPTCQPRTSRAPSRCGHTSCTPIQSTRGRRGHFPHLTDKETRFQRGQVSRLRSHGFEAADSHPHSKPTSLFSLAGPTRQGPATQSRLRTGSLSISWAWLRAEPGPHQIRTSTSAARPGDPPCTLTWEQPPWGAREIELATYLLPSFLMW